MDTSNLTSVTNQVATQAELNSVSFGPKAMAQTFFDQMTSVMKSYADKNAPMDVNGIHVNAEDKYNTLGTTVLNQFLEQNNNAIDTVVTLEQFLIKLESDVSKISGGG